MVLDNGINAVHLCSVLLVHPCSVLLVHHDDEAVQFKQEQEHRNLHGQVIVVNCGLCLLLHGALVLVATVMMAKMGKVTMAVVT